MKRIFLTLFCCICFFSYSKGQENWRWTAGLENHFQFNKTAIKNLEPSGAYANMLRNNFSGTEGAGLSLGLVRKSDSSSFISSFGIQHIWSTLVTTGSTVDANLQKSEFIQSTQTSLKLGLGYANTGRFKYSIQAGPILPLRNRSRSSIYYKDNQNEFTAFYDAAFKAGIGLWLAADYEFFINSKMQGYFGIGTQLLNRNITNRKLTSFEKKQGTVNQSDYAPEIYHQQYDFQNEVSNNMNDEITNPGGVDYTKPRELVSQTYSFSSIYLQFGIKHTLF